jgi:hypothetical protein
MAELETSGGAPDRSGARVKGVAFRSVIASLEELRGAAAVESMYARLPEAARGTVRYSIVNTGWYGIELYRALLEAIEAEGADQPNFLRRIGGLSIRRDITGVYRVLFKILSPETILALSGKLFGHYYDTGSVEIAEGRSGYARAEYVGCRGFDRRMWLEILGSAEELLTFGGAKNLEIDITRGGAAGSNFCTFVATWR